MRRTPRQVVVADHLWDAFGRLSEALGSDRDALVNEAMQDFARQHGIALPEEADRRAVADRVLATAARLEREMAEAPPPLGVRPRRLQLVRDDGTVVEVTKERWIVGRGAHCDLVVDSPKISREHAALVRGADGTWAIEDLGSSNGTWFMGERIARRRIEPGDEYWLCAERIRCELS